MTAKPIIEAPKNPYELSLYLKGSLLRFTRYFYYVRTGREYVVSQPVSREPHPITIAKGLTKAFNHEVSRLYIGCPPRYGKTEEVLHFVAWALAHYPDSQFIYLSYSASLASKQTQTIRQIISLPEYQRLFGISISPESKAKDDFSLIYKKKNMGRIYAAGTGGTITGTGAGIKGANRFGGAIIIDDAHKPDEAASDSMRNTVIRTYQNTVHSRVNDRDTPVIFIGQRVHEEDLAGWLLAGNDDREWDKIILPALSEHGHALDPSRHSRHELLMMKEKNPYDFAAQYQQDPVPAGGALYQESDFALLHKTPDILATFITCDTAETDKSHNDATVFSFWGLYKVNDFGTDTDVYALHWLDCHETRIEPKDLKDEFMVFYTKALGFGLQPSFVAIEKKSTGVTLVSVLKEMRGLNILPIERNISSGSKANRFKDIQYFIASKLISLPQDGYHTDKCIKHMIKITANNSHRFDDIADTCADAIKLALVDKLVIKNIANKNSQQATNDYANKLMRERMANYQREREQRWN